MRHSFMKIHNFKRGLSVPVILALAVSVIAVSAFAYLLVQGRAHSSLDMANEVTPSIDDYAVNVGETGYDMYVRAAVTVNWVNGKQIYALSPKVSTDYNISFDTTNWFYKDGFYYYKKPVASNANTTALVSAFEMIGTPPTGYTLTLNMVAQTIQAKGTTDADNTPAVEDAWKSVTVDGSGNLIPKP